MISSSCIVVEDLTFKTGSFNGKSKSIIIIDKLGHFCYIKKSYIIMPVVETAFSKD
jgi:hypothetical protein